MRKVRGSRSPVMCRALAACAVVLALAPVPGRGHDGKAHGPANGSAALPAPDAAGAEVTVADVALVDRNRRAVRFASQVLAERIVVIDFIYTTCTTICPVTSSILAEVQEALGDRLDREARLITLSIDPVRDTPGRMSAAAAKFGAGPGWLWLTGAKPDMDRLLKGLGAYTPDIESHPPMILVGDAANDNWRRLYGFASPDEIVARIDALLDARKGTRSSMRPGG